MAELERTKDRAPIPAGWEYASAPESRDLVTLRERYGLFVGGEWPEPKESYTPIDPSSEESLAGAGQAGRTEGKPPGQPPPHPHRNAWHAPPAPPRAQI